MGKCSSQGRCSSRKQEVPCSVQKTLFSRGRELKTASKTDGRKVGTWVLTPELLSFGSETTSGVAEGWNDSSVSVRYLGLGLPGLLIFLNYFFAAFCFQLRTAAGSMTLHRLHSSAARFQSQPEVCGYMCNGEHLWAWQALKPYESMGETRLWPVYRKRCFLPRYNKYHPSQRLYGPGKIILYLYIPHGSNADFGLVSLSCLWYF